MTSSLFQSLVPGTPPIDLHVALITCKMSLFLPVHLFLPMPFVYFVPTSLIPSLECMPSKLSNPLAENELFQLILLTLLLASTFLIHSTHGLLARTVYSFTRASFTFQNLPHCIWTSCENTMMPHSSATPALLELSN